MVHTVLCILFVHPPAQRSLLQFVGRSRTRSPAKHRTSALSMNFILTNSMKNMHPRIAVVLSAFLAISLLTGCAGPDKASSTENKPDQQQSEQDQQAEASNQTSEADSNEGSDVHYRINAGASEEYKTEEGVTWTPDKMRWKGEEEWGAEGGKAVDRGGIEIRNTDRDPIYRHERWGMPGYSFKVPNGTYKLRLHFAETYHGVETPADRIFSVAVEGKNVLKDLDVYKEAGNSRRTAVVRTIKNVNVTDGELNIVFHFQTLTPIINGIEVISMP